MDLEAHDKQTLARYNRRLEQFGATVKTLGWDSEASQRVRFTQALRITAFHKKRVLDLGCGFADFFQFLKTSQVEVAHYTGTDLNECFLQEARLRHPEGTFHCGNFVRMPPEGVFDVGVMVGLLNFRLQDNWAYAKTLIGQAFSLCREALVFDALSARRTPEYPEEPQVFYYDPAQMAALATSLTPDWALLHDYPAIPQREMMVCLKRGTYD